MSVIRRIQIAADTPEPETFNIDGFRKILAVAPARGGPVFWGIDLWYLVGDLNVPAVQVTVSVAGTGRLLDVDLQTESNYVGTCVMSDGYVQHVFADIAW